MAVTEKAVGLAAVAGDAVFAESSTAVAAAVGGADALDGEGTSLAAAEAIVTAQAHSKQKITLAVILVATSVCSAKFLEGYTSGVISGVLVLLDPDFYNNNELLEGLIASASVIGILFGVMFAWTPFGRKRPLIGASLIAIVAASFMVWSPVVWVLIGARFVAGYGIGIAFVQVPLFLAECAPPSRRGFVVSLSYLFQVLGVLSAYLVNFTVVMLSSENWRLLLGMILVPASIMLVLTSFVPESPRWLVSKLRIAEAAVVLRRLRHEGDVSAELRVIINNMFTSPDGAEPASILVDTGAYFADEAHSGGPNHDDGLDADDKAPLLRSSPAAVTHDHGHPPTSARHHLVPMRTGPSVGVLFRRTDARRAFLICVGLEFIQQFCGIQAIILYTPVILKESGVAYLFVDLGLTEAQSVLLMTALMYSCKLPFLYLGMTNVDRIGRRLILLITLPIMALSLAGVAISFALPADSNAGAILAVIATTTFGCSYSPGLGSVLSVIESEIFASDVRSTGLVMTGICGTIFNIIIVQFYPKLSESLGELAVFSAFSVISALGFFYVYLVLPETKLQPLELTYRKLVAKSVSLNS